MLTIGAGSLFPADNLILLTREDISFSSFCLFKIIPQVMETKVC